MNVFNSAGTAFLGPQPFAFDRAAMLAGTPATFVTHRASPSAPTRRRLSCPPTSTARPCRPPARRTRSSSVPGSGDLQDLPLPRRLRHAGQLDLHALRQPRAAAGFTALCPTTRACVPQLGTATSLDGIGDRLHVPRSPTAASPTATKRWSATTPSAPAAWPASAGSSSQRHRRAGRRSSRRAPTSPTPPGAGWAARRWTGSGNLALGFSASSATINPQIRYAGPAGDRPARTRWRRARPPLRRHRQPDRHRQPLGRLQRPDRRPGRRLHLLVHAASTTRRPAASTGGRASATSSSLPEPDSASTSATAPATSASAPASASRRPAASASARTLTVTKAGTGTGTVTSSPGGINCGTTCAATSRTALR